MKIDGTITITISFESADSELTLGVLSYVDEKLDDYVEGTTESIDLDPDFILKTYGCVVVIDNDIDVEPERSEEDAEE